MPSHAAARRRAPARHHARPAHPRHARRISGPAHAVALPAPPRRGTTGLFERIRALPENRVVDRILRGRACIWIIGLMLGGIVAMQVSLLKLNASISQSIELSSTLERTNADLETQVAQLSSGERIQSAAIKEGMVAPPAGDVGFLTSRPHDVRLALRRMTAPSAEAREVMANGGQVTAPVVAATTVAATTTTATAAVATPAPTVAATPAPTVEAPTPTPTPQPVATQAPDATTAPTG
jgi:cell division protein FtsL